MRSICRVLLFSTMLGCGSGVPCGPLYPQGCPPWMVCTIVSGQFTCERANVPNMSKEADACDADMAICR